MNTKILQNQSEVSAYELQLTSGQLSYLSDANQTINRTACLYSLIDRAALQKSAYSKKGFETELDIGQLAISEVELAQIWGCNRKSASKLINKFNELGFITSVSNNRTSVHTIHSVSRWLVDGKVINNPHATFPKSSTQNVFPFMNSNI